MEKDFSKMNLSTGLVTLRKKLPAIAARKNIFRSASVLNNSLAISGFLLMVTVLLVIAQTWSIHYARQHAALPGFVAQLQTQHLRIANAVEHTLNGDEDTFTALNDDFHRLSRDIAALVQGSTFRHDQWVSTIDYLHLASLGEYHSHWRQMEKKIRVILNQRESVLRLNNGIKAISVSYNQLIRRADELTDYMTQVGNMPQETRAIEMIKMHARTIARNVKMLQQLDAPLPEISQQLIQDHAQISAMVQTLRQGYNGLGTASNKDETIQDLISHLYALLAKFDDHMHVLQQELPMAYALQPVIEAVVSQTDVSLSELDALIGEIRREIRQTADLFDIAIYLLGMCAIAALALLIRSMHRNAQYQDWLNRNEIQKTQQAIVLLLDDMKRIADGDLTVRTDITANTTGAIADAINCTIEELHTLVEQVNQATELVVKASSQAQQVSSGLLTAAQHQTEKIEQSTLAVLGMTESISDISDFAAESAKVAKQSLATAEKGAAAVRETIDGMNDIRTHIQDTAKRIKRLGESSQEIGEIVALISEITEQTNVLALNAALQATAAGEAGHGFTIIAQEVQRLAERSTEASKQISELIVTIQGDTQDAIAAMERCALGVAKGAKRSDAAGRALEEIEQVSKQLAQLVANIFDITNTQTRAAHKVVANMEGILHITRQNTEGTTKTAASIKQISGFASELKASVSNFKV
ncbi:MAG: methyl-accepting chemotaxis protein [Nitrosomonas sp.]|nr:MAG: methyl-accepting chemotaxis protein [Nitrosomonas sp.]